MMAFRGRHVVVLVLCLPCLVVSIQDTAKKVTRPGSTGLAITLSSVGMMPQATFFLKRYGYLDQSFSGGFNTLSTTAAGTLQSNASSHMNNAITTFQKNYGLNPTGVLDKNTMRLIKSPRCGNPDIVKGTNFVAKKPGSKSNLHTVSHYELFPDYDTPEEGDYYKWNKTNITYGFFSTIDDPVWSVPPKTLRPILKSAFARWSKVTNFTFVEIEEISDTAPLPDIQISMHRGAHNDGHDFTGSNDALAHGFPPMLGVLHFDADEKWVNMINPVEGKYDIETVAVHEIGHLLGLQHCSLNDSIMYPYTVIGQIKRDLGPDDIEGIHTLYGIK